MKKPLDRVVGRSKVGIHLEMSGFIDWKYKNHMITSVKRLIQFSFIVAVGSP